MATLKDVAREAGLSVGTVSRVLNNRGYISEETRIRVRDAMEKLHYQPNAMARSLSKQSSSMIGVIVPNIAHPYFCQVISCLENAAHREGYEILTFASHGKLSREEEYVQMCSGNRVAGLILCTGSVKTAKLKDLGFPVITYERFLNDADAGVECNNYEGGMLAAEELIQKGCRKLICISGAADVSMPAEARKEGFRDVCAAHPDVSARSFTCSPERIGDLKYMDEIRRFLDEVPDADGVFADSDVIAIQTVCALREKGRQVPEHVRVVGYDDILFADMVSPGVTTIHQPVQEMADACIDIIKKAAVGEAYPARTVFHVSLVRRETS